MVAKLKEYSIAALFKVKKAELDDQINAKFKDHNKAGHETENHTKKRVNFVKGGQ